MLVVFWLITDLIQLCTDNGYILVSNNYLYILILIK